METKWLKAGELGIEENGWYVVEGDHVLAGPCDTREQAEERIRDHTPKPPGI